MFYNLKHGVDALVSMPTDKIPPKKTLILTKTSQNPPKDSSLFSRAARLISDAARYVVVGFLGVVIVYLSMVNTSASVAANERQSIDRAITLLESKGFDREVFLLRHVATFRASDNVLNDLAPSESAYAATNFPFGIITIYPDFYTKAVDDTERAMILLHEAQHLQGSDEHEAYAYVWQNRERLGWTQLSHGETEAYVTIELLTREHAPELFTCENKVWNDCTETLEKVKSKK